MNRLAGDNLEFSSLGVTNTLVESGHGALGSRIAGWERGHL